MADKIKNTAVWISVVIGALMALYGAYSLFVSKIVEKDRRTQSEIVQEQAVKDLSQTTAVMMVKIDTIMAHQAMMMLKVNENTKDTKYVINGFKKHLKATDRLEEYLNFIEF